MAQGLSLPHLRLIITEGPLSGPLCDQPPIWEPNGLSLWEPFNARAGAGKLMGCIGLRTMWRTGRG